MYCLSDSITGGGTRSGTSVSLGKRKKSDEESNNNNNSSGAAATTTTSTSGGGGGGGHEDDGLDVEDSGDEGSLSRGEAQRKKKARTTFTGRQIFELEKQFELKKYLSSSERADMAKLLNVTETQVGAPLFSNSYSDRFLGFRCGNYRSTTLMVNKSTNFDRI